MHKYAIMIMMYLIITGMNPFGGVFGSGKEPVNGYSTQQSYINQNVTNFRE